MERLFACSLAACVHPYAAWRVGSVAVRVWLLGSYFTASFVVVFSALELLAWETVGL